MKTYTIANTTTGKQVDTIQTIMQVKSFAKAAEALNKINHYKVWEEIKSNGTVSYDNSITLNDFLITHNNK